jgi:hypothetical protein
VRTATSLHEARPGNEEFPLRTLDRCICVIHLVNIRNAATTFRAVMASEFIGELRDDGQLDDEGNSVPRVSRTGKYLKQQCNISTK